ncbi:MAG: 2-C-methyl-D-erythritol 4-phosphate cytidylyltransferase [Pelotomaculum sp.]|nr:2-C-methyl-D-erythritol 4-phosphate cytidylyltransferase [Pelotomaculum sp.]
MDKVAAVVAAAGRGSRMGTETRKQYLSLAGLPVVGHVLRAMEASSAVKSVVTVVAPGEENYFRLTVVERLGIRKVAAIVPGGEERQDSVYNGLLALAPDTGIVVVHDGARPLLSPGDINAVVQAAAAYGAATLAVPVKDTVKMAGRDGFVLRTLPREHLWLVQTPQAFRYDIIMNAHRQARQKKYAATDDAGLVELLGRPVKIVAGSYENIKITTPEDLTVAEAVIKARQGRLAEAGG